MDDPGIRHKRAEVREKLVRLAHDTTPISECTRGPGRDAPAELILTTPATEEAETRGRPVGESMITAALAGAAFSLTLFSAR